VVVDVGVLGKLGGRQWKRKLENQTKHGTKQKDWQPTGPEGGVSQLSYAPEGATGNNNNKIKNKNFKQF
jgi:hypothetical protein